MSRWVGEPLRGFMLLTLGTVPGATGMMDAVLLATALALIAAVSIVPALALLDSADGLAVRGGQRGRALKGCCGEGGEEVTQGGQGRRPCMSELLRS